MRSNKGTKTSRGFTIIEIMIALLVVTIAIVGYVGANIMAQRNAEEMHERTIAIQDANRIIEQMRTASKTATFPANVVTAFPSPDPSGKISQFSNLTNENISVSYANATANPLDVLVTISWTSYARRTSREVLRTYITQR